MENKQKKEKIQNVKEEKRERIIKIITACLITILISMIGFVGIYTQKQNQMKNQIKDYDLSMDLKGARILSIKPKEDKETIIKDTEGNKITEELTDEQITEKGYTKEEVNKNAEKLTKENFEKTKTIIQKRLKNMGIENYIIRLNEETGEIFIELEENTETDTIVSNIGATGKFEIQDSETKEVLLDNSDIKLVDVRYNTAETGTDVYLNIQFDKEGKNKLTEITENYKTINTTTENTTSESETTEAQKKVVIKIDDEEVTTTSFDNIIRTGSLQLTVGKSSTSRSKINENAKKANNIASTLSFGNLPVDYEVSQNEYILSNITTKKIQQLITIIAIIAVIGLIALMLRYKLTGVLSSIAFIGFTALYLLLVRYANVIITLEGIFGIAVILVINYILTNKIANSNEKEKTAKEVKKEYGKSWLKIIPICIISIVFSFARWTPIASLGMVMLWGLALSAVYQLFITIPLIKINDKSNK